MLFAIGEDVPYVMRQVGHSNPTVTLAAYAQVIFRAEGERRRLRALVEGSDWAGTGREWPEESRERVGPPTAVVGETPQLQGTDRVGDPGLEPGTSSLSERRSDRLS